MRYLALACDYDGTLAADGCVASETVSVLERVLASGRKLVLVTGRELNDLRSVFSRLDLFEWVVAETESALPTRGQPRKGPRSTSPRNSSLLPCAKHAWSLSMLAR